MAKNVNCSSDQIINPKTGRCVKKDGKIGKSIRAAKKHGSKSPRKRSSKSPRRKSSSLSSCGSGKIRNPVTGKCVKKDGRVGKSILAKKKRSSKSPRRKNSSLSSCGSGKIRNPVTGKCVKKDGRVGKSILAKKKRSSKSPRRKNSSLSSCGSGKIRNPVTGKCVKKDGRVGKSILAKKKRSSKSPRRKHETSSRSPIEAATPSPRLVRPGDCVGRSRLELKKLQHDAVEWIRKHSSLLVVHGTGCGKTLTAVTASQCYLDDNPSKRIIFVGPASLLSNFRKEMVTYGVKNTDKYFLYSYDQFMNLAKRGETVDCKDAMLILDEAHNLRTLVKYKEDSVGRRIIHEGRKTSTVFQCATKADKRLLLTATPFVNNITDLIWIINILYGKMVVGTGKDKKSGLVDEVITKKFTEHDIEVLSYFLKDKVDFQDCKNPADFPTRTDHKIDVPMSDSFYKIYEKAVRGEDVNGINFGLYPERFYHAYRRAVNRCGPNYYTAKIEASIPILKQGKSIVYSNWLSFGTNPIEKALKNNNITYRIFTGDTKPKLRGELVKDFNDDKFQVLVITKAGGEGIDLKGVRSVVVMEPPWNDAALQQIIGRAIRFLSHEHLPASQRNVNIYLMALVEPTNLVLEGNSKSGRYITI